MFIDSPIIMIELKVMYFDTLNQFDLTITKLTNKIAKTIINCENSTPNAKPKRGFNLESKGNVI
jgi:hypothetical protein